LVEALPWLWGMEARTPIEASGMSILQDVELIFKP
jgi:hypothetical protein